MQVVGDHSWAHVPIDSQPAMQIRWLWSNTQPFKIIDFLTPWLEFCELKQTLKNACQI